MLSSSSSQRGLDCGNILFLLRSEKKWSSVTDCCLRLSFTAGKEREMISSTICFTPPPSSTRTTTAASLWLGQRPPLSTHLRPPFPPRCYKLTQRKIAGGICKAELSQDAPFAVAIGACILNSLVFPSISPLSDDERGDSVIDSTDSRFAVMGIISFIPYFNWLSWVFAWLDTGKQRYVLYSLVYLAPYLRSNLSLSPEESWLPIASILFCIIHIQLEVSVQNGDLQAFQLFKDAGKHLSSSVARKREEDQLKDHRRDFQEEKGMEDIKNLPDAQEKSRSDIQEWGVPKKPFQDSDYLDEDGEADRRKH